MLLTYAMMASLVVYVVIVEILNRGESQPGVAAGVYPARYIFYAFAAATVFATHLTRALVLRRLRGLDLDAALSRLQSASVAAAGLSETPAILGFVMFLVWRQHTDFYVLTLVSVYLFVRHFPRYGQWESAVRWATTGDKAE